MLLGDLNFPTIDWSDPKNPKLPYSSDKSDTKIQIEALLELTDELLLDQLISQPTRGQNVLDIAFTNITSDLFDCEITTCAAMSDHNIVDMQIPNLEPQSTSETPRSEPNDSQPELNDLNFYKADWPNISAELSKVDWKEVMKNKDVDNQLSTMMKSIKEIVVKHTPKRRKNTGKSKNSFFKERRALWRKRRRLMTKLHHCQNSDYKDSLNTLLEKIQCDIRKSFENELVNSENEAIEKILENPKFFFSYSKQKLQKHSKIGPLKKENKIISEPKEIAECLQEQFCSVFSSPKEDERIENIDEFFCCDESAPGINDVQFTEEDIEKVISEIKSNSACGDDGFSALLLKNCKKELSVPLYILWRHSLDTSEVPSFLKRSKICPIHKGSLKCVPKNYRPVALTSHLIKLFEKILRNEIVKYLEKSNLMNNNQHGFRKFRSCLSQLLDHYDLLIEILQSNKNADVVYLDFSKAFDVVDHHILLRKLKGLGISGLLGKWIYQFLTNRTQYVTVEGQSSSEAPVLSGVPQGSVLGPVLFLIMISDIDVNIVDSIIKTFADDTKVTQQICSMEDGNLLQESLEKIYEWARKNNMQFNSTKFNLLRYGTNSELKQNISYKNPNNEVIEESDNVKDLGVQMSANLTFTEHISKVSKTCKRLVYWILRTFKTRNKKPLITLYNSLVLPRLDYCSQLFSPHKQLEWKLMESVQRTLTSKISELSDQNYWQRLKQLKMYSIHRRHERYQIIYIYKIIENLAPNLSVNKIITKYSDRRGRECIIPTISNSQCPAVVKNAREASLPIRGAKLFNMLPVHLRNITGVKVESFKRRLDKYLATIPDEPTVDGYYGMRAANSNSLLDVIPLLRAATRAGDLQPVNDVEVDDP